MDRHVSQVIMSKRKREATEGGESASINGLKKARKDQRNGRHKEDGPGDDSVITTQSNASLDSHAIVPAANTDEEKLAIKLARKQAKKEKRRKGKDRAVEVSGDSNGVLASGPIMTKRLKRRARAAGDKPTVEDFKGSGWKVSDPVGGRLLDLDPVFSPDEKYGCVPS